MSHSAEETGAGSGFSRRAFLRGSSVAAAATALATREADAEDKKQPATKVAAKGPQTIPLTVNGKSVQAKVEPRTTLLEVLRLQLDLTGAKPVDADGSSGASTVLIDGKPVSASTTLAMTCQGKKIVTVEGLVVKDAKGGVTADPVCHAFVANDAQQCGFCTPGFVVAVRAFLNDHPQATEAEIKAGLNGNICRCGTYANILPAVISLVKGA